MKVRSPLVRLLVVAASMVLGVAAVAGVASAHGGDITIDASGSVSGTTVTYSVHLIWEDGHDVIGQGVVISATGPGGSRSASLPATNSSGRTSGSIALSDGTWSVTFNTDGGTRTISQKVGADPVTAPPPTPAPTAAPTPAPAPTGQASPPTTRKVGAVTTTARPGATTTSTTPDAAATTTTAAVVAGETTTVAESATTIAAVSTTTASTTTTIEVTEIASASASSSKGDDDGSGGWIVGGVVAGVAALGGGAALWRRRVSPAPASGATDE